MNPPSIGKQNVGRIAERIVSNELEFRGFRVSDLNKEGTSANADLLAVRDGKAWQIQVKGATYDNGHWIHYGYCSEAVIAKQESMFNRCSASGFYKADAVVLVSVKAPDEYHCVVLPVGAAETAAQINLDRDYRIPTAKGNPKKPGKAWISLDWIPNPREPAKRDLIIKELEILKLYRNNWKMFDEITD